MLRKRSSMNRGLFIGLSIVFLLAGFVRADVTLPVDDDDFHLLLVKRKLPTPDTLEDFATIVSRMRRVGASNSDIADWMSRVIDGQLVASNQPQRGESIFNPLKKGAIAERE